MPSFLSKVFGRKKGDDKESVTPRSVRRSSDPSLLEGKFEAVPPTVSPSTPKFPEDASEKGKEGDKARQFGLLKSKSRPRPSSPTIDAPHLTLRLPGTIGKNEDSLVPSFNPQADETDESSLTRRLTPEETLSLIEACSKAIVERGGLETLGVMRPHWHSTSPQLQRKLISLFILSLAHKSPETTLAPSASPLTAFNSELEYTRSVHDIAAVFRWALRHLRLEGTSFGSSSSSDEWSWYNNFYEAERKSGYDPRAFTTKLVPEITSTHTTLLLPILDAISSLAAHAEVNGYSGSKLTKYFGFWLLTARRAAGTDDWSSFYTRWEVSGRMFEHLFLSWLRDENTKRPLPKRLQELVAQYPYTTSSDQTADGLLTRPRFSTRRYDALFVRVEAVYTNTVHIPSSRSPVGVFTDALESEPRIDGGGHLYLWNQVKAVATSDSDDTPLPAILSDDTVNLLSLVSTDPKEQALLGITGAASLSPITEAPLYPIPNGNRVSIPLRKPTLPSSTPQSPKDWAEFSSAGFGETTLSQDFASTLLDKDVEVTEPPVQRRPSKQRQNKTTVAPVEPSPPTSDPKPAPEKPEKPRFILATTKVVQLDEAFIDFWRDAVVDPISSDWPNLVIGELKHPLTLSSTATSSEGGENVAAGSPINWIIIEERFRRRTPPPTPVIPPETLSTSGGLKIPASPLRRTSSPRPSFGEKKTPSLSATLKRFTFFGTSKDDLTTEDTSPTAGGSGKKDSFGGRKKFGMGKSPKVGEMGEAVLSEEPEPRPEVLNKVDENKKVEKMEKGEVVAVAAGAVGGSLLATTAGIDGVDPTKEDLKEDATAKHDELLAPRQADPPVEDEKLEVPVASDPEVFKSTPDIPTPKKPSPTPLVSSTTEPKVSEGPYPDVVEKSKLQVAEVEVDTLPPVPESVISHGETPGPQLALDSTEAGLHHVPDLEEPQEPTTDFAAPPSEPVVEHLEDKVEDSAADVGVDLDPVPIVPNDLINVQEVEEPEVLPESDIITDEKAGEQMVEEVPATAVRSTETPVSLSEQKAEPIPINSIVEDGTVEGPQAAVTQDPDVLPVSEPEEIVETADVVTEDVSVDQRALDVPVLEPTYQHTDAELHPVSQELTEVQETV